MKQLLVDYMSFEVSPHLIEESIKRNGKIIVSGTLQRADAQNQNGRTYPKPILVREAKKYVTMIKERRALGELDHPDSSVVNLANVSHNLTEMHWSGDDLVGTVEILTTPSGNILKELFRNGIKLGISSRGLGSTQDDGQGNQEVQEDFELIAFDFVSNPSTHGAFMKPLREGKEHKVVRPYAKINELVTDILMEVGDGKNYT